MASPVAQLSSTLDHEGIKDVTLATFMADVIEVSKTQPVLVNFWATWSGPCKILTPLLEKLVRATKGAVRLAKLDIDRNPEIAQQMGVQQVPAVFAFFQGRPIDGFMGALPEPQVKAWIDKIIKTTGATASGDDEPGFDIALKQANEFLAAADTVAAQSIYMDVLDQDPSNIAATVGVLRCLLARGDIEKARTMLTAAPAPLVKDKAFDPIRTALDLAEQAGKTGSVDDLREATEKNPSDHQARFDLAMAYYAANRREDAVDSLLDIVRRDRKWNDDAARKQLVKFFEAFGVMDPLTVDARKRLSSIMFS